LEKKRQPHVGAIAYARVETLIGPKQFFVKRGCWQKVHDLQW